MDSEPANDSEYDRVMAELLATEVTPSKKIPRVRVEQPDNGLSALYPATDTEYDPPTKMIEDDFPISDELILTVRNTLGLKQDKWDNAKVKALKELGGITWMKLSVRALSLVMFDSIQRVESTMEAAERLINAPQGKVSDDIRISAGTMMAACAKGMKDLAAQTLVTLERGLDSKPDTKFKPKNRPPQFGVQVNVSPGGNASVGLTEQKPANMPRIVKSINGSKTSSVD